MSRAPLCHNSIAPPVAACQASKSSTLGRDSKAKFAEKGIAILKEGDVTGEEIDKNGYID